MPETMKVSRKLAVICTALVILIVILLVTLWQTGFLFPNRNVVSGKGFIPVDQQTLHQYENQTSPHDHTPNLFFYIMNLTKTIPDINKVTMQVFYSNDSLASVKNQYDTLLQKDGYCPQPKYSGTYSKWNQSISFLTYNRWSTGVVIILSTSQGKTWICYIIGSVFDLLSIYNYLSTHGYLQ